MLQVYRLQGVGVFFGSTRPLLSIMEGGDDDDDDDLEATIIDLTRAPLLDVSGVHVCVCMCVWTGLGGQAGPICRQVSQAAPHCFACGAHV
jgi:MFS superfamily sulfate permease-like transporter